MEAEPNAEEVLRRRLGKWLGCRPKHDVNQTRRKCLEVCASFFTPVAGQALLSSTSTSLAT